ncbi:MAG: Ig-like domain-containing domain [Spirosomaceae bacterium]|nr:Ig-like domain-containing domain [Spirosomataceae bacterium]
MNYRQKNTQVLLLISYCLLLFGCAQSVPPTGGKKDVIPPKLVKSIPVHKQTNYQDKTLELEFDEYVVVENLQQKLLITPDPGEYESKVKPKGLRLIFKKSLDSAKTYSFSFGDAIKDFAEKNPARNLRVVFSTGPSIDSASVSGEVTDLLTNKKELDILVGLYPNTDTLNIEKMKPYYFTRTDSSGKFSLENLQANTYRLVAFDDRNRSLTYNLKAERIAYMKDSIVVKDSTQMSGVLLKLYMANFTPPKVRNTTPRANFYSINYDKGFTDYKIKFNSPEDSIPCFQSNPTELKFFNTKNRKDTLVVKIAVTDSLGLVFEHTQKIKFREARTKADTSKEPIDFATNFGESNAIKPKQLNLRWTFTKPIAEARLHQIKIVSDSTKVENVKPEDFKWENNRSVLTLERPILAKQELKIELPKATIFGIENDTIPAKTFKISIMQEEDFGTIQGEVKNAKDQKFFVELLNDKYETIEKISNKTPFEFGYIKPAATYFVRVTIDKNANNRWDAGDFKTKRIPEPVFFYAEPLKVKKNFVLSGIDVDLGMR